MQVYLIITSKYKVTNNVNLSFPFMLRITANEMVISSSKYEVATYPKSIFEVRMRVLVRNLSPEDVGSYKCIAKNSLGEVESNIRLYGKFYM